MKRIAFIVAVLATLCFTACSEHRQAKEPIGPVHPPIARFIGDELSRMVPDALAPIATDALALLFSDRAAVYSNWPGAIKGRPPQPPFKEFNVERLGVIGQPDTVRVSLLESGPNRRVFSVYWNTVSNECEEISIIMP